MEERVYLTELYDYYKGLLTEKQRSNFEDYYFDNLTMDEIADNNNVSKNAISKTLLDVKNKLEDYEKILNLKYNRDSIIKVLNNEEIEKIEEFI